jgi:hypothetical protein
MSQRNLVPAVEIVYRVDLPPGARLDLAAVRAAVDVAGGGEDAMADALWTEGGPGATIEEGSVLLDAIRALPVEDAPPGVDLDAIEARALAATPGPMGVALDGAVVVVESPRDFLTLADVEFYDAARTDVPALLRLVRALLGAVAEARGHLSTAHDGLRSFASVDRVMVLRSHIDRALAALSRLPTVAPAPSPEEMPPPTVNEIAKTINLATAAMVRGDIGDAGALLACADAAKRERARRGSP